MNLINSNAAFLTRDGHEEGRRRDDLQHLRAEGSKHDRDDSGDEVGSEGHVVRLGEAGRRRHVGSFWVAMGSRRDRRV